MDANMTMNGTEGNMTMNATEMANDTIAEGEMPVESSDDGRRRLLQLGDAISGAVDNAKETAKDVAGKVEETGKKVVDKANEVVNKVNETIDGAGEMMPEEGEMPVESSDDGR